MQTKIFNEKNLELQEYYKILCEDFPNFLYDYLETPELKRLSGIGQFCGMDYVNYSIFNPKYFFSRLDHSIAVALIIWNFTHDKKQTLAGLFHDISCPTFSHVVDFMNGDSINQESTEEYTNIIIENSKEITALLKRDNIKLEEIVDYKLYPIADNERPKLSADRLEGLFNFELICSQNWDLNDIKEIYNNIDIFKNEDNIEELGLKSINVSQKFIDGMFDFAYKLQQKEWILMINFIGDILKHSINNNIMTKDDLFTLTENDIINRIKNSNNTKIQNAWNHLETINNVYKSNYAVSDKYSYCPPSKKRYINPLVATSSIVDRVTNILPEIKNNINKFCQTNDNHYVYIDFNF